MKKPTYRILIAEDDALISEALKNYLEDMGHSVIGIVSNLDGAVELLDEQPDFCFLDIRMHGKDVGFEIAATIKEKYYVPFLFLTSFADEKTVKEASKFQPAGYLLKPFREADIYTSLEVAMARAKIENSDKIEIRDGIKTYFIPTNEILFVKAENIYVEIQTQNRRFLERISLDKFLKRLPDNFIRCHRSYIVNKNAISGIGSMELQIGKNKIPVSRTYRDNL